MSPVVHSYSRDVAPGPLWDKFCFFADDHHDSVRGRPRLMYDFRAAKEENSYHGRCQHNLQHVSREPGSAWRGGMRIFAAYFWHTEGWTPRNEAILEVVLKRARVTKHLCLLACDADKSPVDFEKSLWFRQDQMHVIAPKEASTCRSKKC